MVERSISLFTNSEGIVYLFDSEPVYSLKANKFKTLQHLVPLISSDPTSGRHWFLIDAAWTPSELPKNLAAIHRPFPVYAVSLDEQGYKECRKRHMAVTWFMKPWSNDKFRARLALQNHPQKRVAMAASSPHESRWLIQQAARALYSVDELARRISGTDESSDEVSHQLFMIRRLESNGPTDGDNTFIDFNLKTRTAYSVFTTHFLNAALCHAYSNSLRREAPLLHLCPAACYIVEVSSHTAKDEIGRLTPTDKDRKAP
ncbi:hypothetical protein NLJ89_g1622 [Agrocybe chaxingu]|uniref:Uncharacterized protein n=1 Tax=Agrocybe chaxingu TaxID=84603 RepID=A0A9W8MZP9_9AGAR|nr:hypothetical protein NLJ89_g1622 [Agrocybe chaxingu]